MQRIWTNFNAAHACDEAALADQEPSSVGKASMVTWRFAGTGEADTSWVATRRADAAEMKERMFG